MLTSEDVQSTFMCRSRRSSSTFVYDANHTTSRNELFPICFH